KGTSTLPVAAVIATAQEDDPGGTPCSAVSVSVVAAPVSICGGSKLACTPAGWPVNSNWMVPESTDAGVVWTRTAIVLPCGSTARPSSSERTAAGGSAATRRTISSAGPSDVAAREYTYGSVRAVAGSDSGSAGYPWNASSVAMDVAFAGPRPVERRHMRVS